MLSTYYEPHNMLIASCAAAKSLQSCPTLCDPIDGSPPGSPVPGILQARTLEWVAISLSNTWKWKVKMKSLSRVWLFATPWNMLSRMVITFLPRSKRLLISWLQSPSTYKILVSLKFHGLYSSWGCKELDVTEWFSLPLSLWSLKLEILLLTYLLSLSPKVCYSLLFKMQAQ